MLKVICEKYESGLMILMGIICIVFKTRIYDIFPVLFGLFLIERGLHGCYEGWKNGDFHDKEHYKLEYSMLVVVIAIGIIIRQKEALIVAAIFWGLTGILKSAKYLNEIFYRISQNGKVSIPLCIAFFVELFLSLILIFEPVANVEHHILILGVQLILEAIFGLLIKIKNRVVE